VLCLRKIDNPCARPPADEAPTERGVELWDRKAHQPSAVPTLHQALSNLGVISRKKLIATLAIKPLFAAKSQDLNIF
jgi:hypothetical protein